MNRIGLVNLAKIELPGGVTIRLSDGGAIKWGSEIYRSRDPVFGAIGAAEALEEGVGDEVPALQMTLLPPTITAAATLSQPGYQQARATFWVVEYNRATNAVVAVVETLFKGQIDQTVLTVGAQKRELGMSIVSLLERLFEANTGNSLSPSFHKLVWPGETGHDQATGVTRALAWGVERPSGAGSPGAAVMGGGPSWRGQIVNYV